jgi:hypothetical protein
LDTKDIDNTLDDYVQYIKNEFAVNLPLTLHKNTDTRKALKNIRDFYKARGTENSFKFLFRLLYGDDISIYIPETDILRASDANWKNVTVIRVDVDPIDPRTTESVTTSDLVGRKIKGEISKATAIVEKAVEIVYRGSKFSELELSNKLGTFVANEDIETDNVGDGTIVRAKVYGLMNSVNITDPGSNYVVGDRVAVNNYLGGSGAGAIAEVATTNATSGAITSMKIIDPGYNYTNAPTLDMTGPHNADAGAARFKAGPLETIFYNDFSQYTDANSFFAESDNRGANSIIGSSIGHPYDSRAYSKQRGYLNPSAVTPNSIFNFTTVPGVDEGLKGYWKMNSYSSKDVRISTADATAGDGHDPGIIEDLDVIDIGLDAQAAYGSQDPWEDAYTEIVDGMKVVTIYNAIDISIGAAWKAFNVEDGFDRTFSVTSKVAPDDATENLDTGNGPYFVLVCEYDSDLPAGVSYVSRWGPDRGGPSVVESNRDIFKISGGARTTSWVTDDFTYTPTSTAKWASVVVLNWSGMENRYLYVQPIYIQGGPAAEGATNVFKGPRVGDITFVANPNYDTLSDVQLSYVNPTYTNPMAVPDRTGANTYLSTGWTGFQPIVRDESGQGHHARVASWRGTTPNLITDGYQDFSKKPESLYVIGPHNSLTEDTPDLYPIAQYGGTPEASINTSFSYVGTSSLEYKITVGGASYMTFANALPVISAYEFRDDAAGVWNGSWVAEIPKGKKWIFSYYAYSDSNIVPEDVWVYCFVRNMEDLEANVAFYKGLTNFSAPHQWERFEMILDLTYDVAPDNSQIIAGDGLVQIYDEYSHGGITVVGNDLKANEIDSVMLNVGSSSVGAHTRSVGNTVLYDGFSLKEYDEFRPTINPRFETAFANAGIFGAGSTSIGTLAEGGLVLMPHDDISSANTQTWSFWFNPSEKSTGTMTDQIGSGSEMIVSRDTVGHWSWSMNAYTSSTVSTGDYIDTLFSFPNATFDNGNAVGSYQKLANSTGYYQ